MTQSWTLRLPFTEPPVTANDARRAGHWSSQATAKIQVEQAVALLVKAARIPPLPRCPGALRALRAAVAAALARPTERK